MLDTQHDIASLEDLAVACIDDPLAFVLAAYPWGESGTPLADSDGPDQWQVEELEAIREHCQRTDDPYRMAIASGHGIGKSAFTSWLIEWFATTRPHPQIVCTANTQQQLRTKTWRELAKWHNMSIFRDWFTWTATMYYHKEHQATWFAAAIPWSEHKAEAFQGTHEEHVMILKDEASIIPPIIWETIEGAMTQPGSFDFSFGNPTKNTGTFRSVFPGGLQAHRWRTRNIDSRTSRLTNKAEIQQWAETYGEDSDFFRVRVKGEFPKQAATQFIGEDLIQVAQRRDKTFSDASPVIVGVDVARFGDDMSVILVRRGPMIEELHSFSRLDTMQFASRVARVIDGTDPDAVFIDVVGVGGGVVDRLDQLGYDVIGVEAGQAATDERHYMNKRAEMWDGMKTWLQEWGRLDAQAHRQLCAELTAPEYGYDARDRMYMERKEDMKERGYASPDEADALALTFAQPVAKRSIFKDEFRAARVARGADFNPMTRW